MDEKEQYKYVTFRPRETPLASGLPDKSVHIRTNNGTWMVTEREFSEMFREYMLQRNNLVMKQAEARDAKGAKDAKDGVKDARTLALDCLAGVVHNLWRGWNEAVVFDEALMDEVMLWAEMLDELRPTFGIARFFPNEVASGRIMRLRSMKPRWIQNELDFWRVYDEKERARYFAAREEALKQEAANYDKALKAKTLTKPPASDVS
jgi:hypothetical protein